jgi:hypothetical protein
MCNSLAGDYYPDSLPDKANYIAMRYENKFAKILRLPRWEPEELKEMGHGLKRKIMSDRAMQRLVVEKMKNLDLVASGFPPVEIDKMDLGKYLTRKNAWQ